LVVVLGGLFESEPERRSLLQRVGLQEAVARKVGGFSKGMKQRLGLAVALLGKPELLVLDEPTDGVDPLGRRDIRALLVEENRRGSTVLLNSHLLSETERVCTQVAILHLGRVLEQGSLEALTQGAHGWSLRFEVPAPGLAAAGFTEVKDDGSCLFVADDSTALNTAIDQARAAGAKLLELKSMEKDLEGVLTEALERGARA
jgi:ABC-2 type transport system ATP-binding protein